MRRVFLAIALGAEIQSACGRVIDELRRRAGASAPRARVTWVVPDRMHITLVFIGQADEALCDGVKAALDSPLQTPAFDLTVSGTGSFPLGRPPRVLWAGLTAGRDRLIQLEREVRSRLASLPVPRDDRPYSPHLTLARVKHPAGLRPKSLLAGFEDASFGTVRVRTVTLFESRLGRQRPEYVGMAGWWLGEPGALSPEP